MDIDYYICVCSDCKLCFFEAKIYSKLVHVKMLKSIKESSTYQLNGTPIFPILRRSSGQNFDY